MSGERRLGWIPDRPDWRDLRLPLATEQEIAALPRYLNLLDSKPSLTQTGRFPPIFTQGNLGSCTAQAGAAIWCYDRARQGLPFVMPSRLFVYYNERVIEGTPTADTGASIRDCLKTLVKDGACDERMWPYDISTFITKPSDACYADAIKHHGVEYSQPYQSLNQLKAVLAGGFPFIFGFTVYRSFMSDDVARTGLMPMPGMMERTVGGHASVAVAYNSRDYFLCRNSWGEDWGDPDYPGHFWMPGIYLTNPKLSGDFWCLRTVSG